MSSTSRRIGVAALVVVVLAWWLFGHRRKPEAEQAGVETVKVARGDLKATVVASGVIEPETSVEVKANAGGEVTSLLVDVGDEVKAGDLLATIDPEDSRTAVRTAGADLSAAKANVSQARASARYEAAVTPARVADAQANVKLARARLNQAQDNLELQRRVTQSNVASAGAGVAAATARVEKAGTSREIEVQVAAAEVRQAEQAEAAAASRIDQAETNLELQRKLYDAALAKAQEAKAGAEARLATAKVQAETRPAGATAEVQQAEAALQAARERLTRLKTSTQPAAAAGTAGEYDSARAALRNAELDAKRQKELYDKGFVPLQTVEQKEAELATAKGRFDVAEKSFQTLKESQAAELAEVEAEVRRSEASLNASRQAAREAGTAPYDLAAAQASVKQAEADLRTAEAGAGQISLRQQELTGAQASAAQARASTAAARARLLNVDIRGREQEEAVAGRDQASATRTQAEANRRLVSLREADVAIARAQLKQAEAALIQALAGPYQVRERESAVRTAQASIARREAELENAQEQLRDTIIRAPRDGVVIERFVEEGTIITSGRSSVAEGTKIVTIADVTKLYCLAEVDEADVAKVKAAQPASLRVEAFPDDEFVAKVRKVYPRGTAEADVTLFTVEMEVRPTPRHLRPGMTAEIEILTQVRKGALTLPVEALHEGPSGFAVKIMKGGQEIDQPVTIGVQTLEQVEISSGVKEGDEVVLPQAAGGSGDEKGGRDKGGQGKGSQGKDTRQRDFQRSMRQGMRGIGAGK